MKHGFVDIIKVPVPDRGQFLEKGLKMNALLFRHRIDSGQLIERGLDLRQCHSRWTQHCHQMVQPQILTLCHCPPGNHLEHNPCSLLFGGSVLIALFQQRSDQIHRILAAKRVPLSLFRPIYSLLFMVISISIFLRLRFQFGSSLGLRLRVSGRVNAEEKEERRDPMDRMPEPH